MINIFPSQYPLEKLFRNYPPLQKSALCAFSCLCKQLQAAAADLIQTLPHPPISISPARICNFHISHPAAENISTTDNHSALQTSTPIYSRTKYYRPNY